MNIGNLTSSGSIPALEKMYLFAGQRQRIINNNIANIDTPNFQAVDVDPKSFQRLLGDAIHTRRRANGGSFGELELKETREISMRNGRLELNPSTNTHGIMFHDRGQKSLETLMQQLVENASTFRVASDLLRQNQRQIEMAIAQRVV